MDMAFKISLVGAQRAFFPLNNIQNIDHSHEFQGSSIALVDANEETVSFSFSSLERFALS